MPSRKVSASAFASGSAGQVVCRPGAAGTGADTRHLPLSGPAPRYAGGGRADWHPGFGANDLEPVATALHPVLAEYIGWLSGFTRARMTGSGACIFAEFERRSEAEAVLAQLPGVCADGLRPASLPIRLPRCTAAWRP